MNKVCRFAWTAVLCLVALVFYSNSVIAAEENPRSTVIAAYHKVADLKSYHMAMTGTIAMSIEDKSFQTTMNSEMDIQIRPLLCKNNMDITINANGKEKQDSVLQYIERAGSRIYLYSYSDGKWSRQAVPGGEYNPAREFGDLVKAIKSAALVSEDEHSAVYEVVADGRYLRDLMKRNLDSLGMKKMGLPDLFAGKLDDLTYTITLDKDTGYISGMDVDLSPLIASIGQRIADQMPVPVEKRQEIIGMFNGMHVQFNYALSQLDSVEPFTIPDEARAE